MKHARYILVLTILAAALLLCGSACAETDTTMALVNGGRLYVYSMPVPGAIYDKVLGKIDALELPEALYGLRAKSNKSWLTCNADGLGFRWRVAKVNTTYQTRSAKLTLTADGYQSTVVVRQLGVDRVKSMKRNKKKVTVKFTLTNSPAHRYTVTRITLRNGQPVPTSAVIIKQGKLTGDKLTFNVSKGYQYAVYVGPALNTGIGDMPDCMTGAALMNVTRTTGTQKAGSILRLRSDGFLR